MSLNELARPGVFAATPPTVSLTVCMVMIAAFSKSFVPFQFFGSTAIFVFSLVLAMLGMLLDWPAYWRRIRAVKRQIFWVAALFGFSIINFFIRSRNSVPDTYLIGMVGLLSLFLVLGIVASLAFPLVLTFLLSMAVIYLLYCVIFLVENGSFYPDGYFGDIFGLGRNWGGLASYNQLYQNVGICLALGTLALIGLIKNLDGKVRFWTLIVFGSACLGFILASQARGALLGLLAASAVAFKFRQIRLMIIFVVGAAMVTALTVGSFLDPVEQLPIWQRTENEILSPKPGTRLVLVNFALRTVFHNPDLLWLGRGLGMFPVDIGDNPPDWLLSSKVASFYPHNPVLEALYELGALGVVLVIVILIVPILMARRLPGGIDRCRAVLSFYVFSLVIEMVSGSLAYSYSFYFIYGLTIGVIANLREEGREADPSLAQFRGTSPG